MSKEFDATLIMQVQIEKDRMSHTMNLLKKMPGIIKMEWFEIKEMV